LKLLVENQKVCFVDFDLLLLNIFIASQIPPTMMTIGMMELSSPIKILKAIPARTMEMIPITIILKMIPIDFLL